MTGSDVDVAFLPQTPIHQFQVIVLCSIMKSTQTLLVKLIKNRFVHNKRAKDTRELLTITDLWRSDVSRITYFIEK
jgi:hypothetical protein